MYRCYASDEILFHSDNAICKFQKCQPIIEYLIKFIQLQSFSISWMAFVYQTHGKCVGADAVSFHVSLFSSVSISMYSRVTPCSGSRINCFEHWNKHIFNFEVQTNHTLVSFHRNDSISNM